MSEGFCRTDLENVVTLAGQLLESEDRFICGCFERNSVYGQSAQVPGITYFKSERYYQALTARALLPSFRFSVKLEYQPFQFDVALFNDVAKPPVALGEMKLWMSSTGNTEIAEKHADIAKLAGQPCAQFLMIFTMSPLGETDENVQRLLRDLGCLDKSYYTYLFSSVYNNGKGNFPKGEFAVVGIMVKEQ